MYTAIAKKIVGKSARDNPERYLRSLFFNFKEWHERPWTYVCEC